MPKKFEPANTTTYRIHLKNTLWVEVNLSRKSGFDGFEEYTDLPCLHLSAAIGDENITWDRRREFSVTTGMVMEVAEVHMTNIIAHFFGDQLMCDDAAWRFEVNSPKAARRQTIHLHLEVGHKDLFGEDGKIRQCVESLLKPKLLMAEGARLLQQNLDYQEGRRDLDADIAQMNFAG